MRTFSKRNNNVLRGHEVNACRRDKAEERQRETGNELIVDPI